MILNKKYLFFPAVFLIFGITSCIRYDQYEEPWTPPTDSIPAPEMVCNGDPDLCNLRYNEAVYPTTHNSFNYEIGTTQFNFPNQDYDVARQLRDGIRGFMLDVYESGGDLVCYHGNAFLGSEPLSVILGHFKDYFAQDSACVVSIIFETDVTGAKIQTAMENAGLINYIHTQPLGQDWPTLGDMIKNGKQLVVFTENQSQAGTPEWFHYAWGHIVDTPYDYGSRSEFTCDYNRGTDGNSLFLINHWISLPLLGTGIKDSAKAVNQYDVLYDRVLGCMNSHDRVANFIAVDFYKQGDLLKVTGDINDLLTPVP
jgi:hypothetical protein